MTSSAPWRRSMFSMYSRSKQQIQELADSGLNIAEVARRAGVSRSFVRSVLGPKFGQRGRPKSGGPLSTFHQHVGLRVSGWFTSFLTYPTLDTRASHFEWSSRKQGQIERGTWDLTLSDLCVLSDKTGIAICELIGESK